MNEKIINILNTYIGEDIDLCYYVFDILKKDSNPELGLETFFESVLTKKSDKSVPLNNNFQIEELRQWEQMYTRYINELLTTLVKKGHIENWNKKMFYLSLWNVINNNLFFENQKLKSFAIFKCAQNGLIPYVQIDTPLTMENEKFIKIINSNSETIKNIRHILAFNFTQKTEMASLILKEILNIKSFEEQTVILAFVLNYFMQDNTKHLLQILSNTGLNNVKLQMEAPEK